MAIRIRSSTEKFSFVETELVIHFPHKCFMVWNVAKIDILEHKPEAWIEIALASRILTFKYIKYVQVQFFLDVRDQTHSWFRMQ